MIEWTFRAGGWASSERPIRIGEPHSSSSMLLGRPLRNGSRKKSGGFCATSRWWAARSGSGRRTNRVPTLLDRAPVEPAASVRRRDVDHAADPRSRRRRSGSRARARGHLLARQLADGTIADARQSRSPVSTAIILQSRPPMLWPTSTIRSNAGSVLPGSSLRRDLVKISPEEICRVGDRVAGRVAERPELEAAIDRRDRPRGPRSSGATTPAWPTARARRRPAILPRT